MLVTLAGLLLAALAAVLVITRWVDPNVFKPRIVAALAAATGRPVTLPGDLELEWYPWLALRTGAGTLGNPAQFPGPPLLRWREAHLGARLLPLLRREFQLDRVQLDGVELQLRRDASGRSNWEGLADTAPGGAASGAPPVRLAGVDLREARVLFSDATDGTEIAVEALDLTTGPWASDSREPLTIEAAFDLRVGRPRLLGQARLQTAVTTGEGAAATLALARTTLAARLHLPGFAAAGVPVKLELPGASLDLERTAYRVPALQLEVGAARFGLRDIAYDHPDEASAAGGASFALAPTSLRGLLVALGLGAPATTDPRALESFALDGRVAFADDRLQVEPLTIVLDDTRLIGRVQRGGAPALLEFTLAGNTMNLDRYLEPEEAASEPFEFPAEALGALRARGTLSFDTATFGDLAFEGLTLRLLLDEQGLRTEPAAPAAAAPAAATAVTPAATAAGTR
jgi:AsmA protein